MVSDSDKLLLSIHKELLDLSKEFALMAQSMGHIEKDLNAYKETQSKKLDDALGRIETLERQRIADQASWRGPRTAISAASAVIALIIGISVFWEKLVGV